MNAIRLSLLMAIVAWALFAQQALAITGGQVDEDNIYSNVGCLFVPGDSEFPPWVSASGTLIHPRVLLTAGHVTAFFDEHYLAAPYFRVTFGNNINEPAAWYEIETWITHPDYRDIGMNNPKSNDVGVIILKQPVINVTPAQLPPYAGFLDDLKAWRLLREPGQGGAPLTVAGYGSTLDWPPPESIPGDGLRRFVQTECLGLTQSWLFTLMNPATGNGAGGYGDSGGPNFWVQPDGTLILVAITSRGDPNLVATNITWRADIPETLDFINQVLALVDE
jgi:hypothetical protein